MANKNEKVLKLRHSENYTEEISLEKHFCCYIFLLHQHRKIKLKYILDFWIHISDENFVTGAGAPRSSEADLQSNQEISDFSGD